MLRPTVTIFHWCRTAYNLCMSWYRPSSGCLSTVVQIVTHVACLIPFSTFSCFAFRSRHSVCGRCLSIIIVPVHTNCFVLLGFVLRSGLRYALHPNHLPKLGYCRSVPVTWPRWFNIKAKPCLKCCRVPFMSTLFLRPFIANVGRVQFLLQCCPNRPLVSWQRRWRRIGETVVELA